MVGRAWGFEAFCLRGPIQGGPYEELRRWACGRAGGRVDGDGGTFTAGSGALKRRAGGGRKTPALPGPLGWGGSRERRG